MLVWSAVGCAGPAVRVIEPVERGQNAPEASAAVAQELLQQVLDECRAEKGRIDYEKLVGSSRTRQLLEDFFSLAARITPESQPRLFEDVNPEPEQEAMFDT